MDDKVCHGCSFQGHCAHVAHLKTASCHLRVAKGNMKTAQVVRLGWSIREKGQRKVFEK